MPHISLPEGTPGIIGPMMAYPETEKHLNGLAEALLRGPSSLTPAEPRDHRRSRFHGERLLLLR